LARSKLALWIILALCVSLQTNLASAQYAVGVNSGNWIKYSITTPTQQVNKTGVLEIDIQTVQGSTITGTYEVSVQGQDMIPASQFEMDVATPGGGFLTGVIIPANLAVGDTIPGEGATVQNVTEWNGRKAIVADARVPYLGFSSKAYWDQQTGVFLEATSSSQNNATGNGTFEIVLTDTSLWNTGSLILNSEWLIIITAAAVIVALATATVILRRRRAQPVQSLPHTSQPTTKQPAPP
jgi:hypothetical protein